MEEAKALVAERRRQAEEDAKRAYEARLAKAKADLEAEKKEGLRIIYADYTHAMRIGDFDKIYELIDNYGADVNWEEVLQEAAVAFKSWWYVQTGLCRQI